MICGLTLYLRQDVIGTNKSGAFAKESADDDRRSAQA